jgi:hypothetical protein
MGSRSSFVRQSFLIRSVSYAIEGNSLRNEGSGNTTSETAAYRSFQLSVKGKPGLFTSQIYPQCQRHGESANTMAKPGDTYADGIKAPDGTPIGGAGAMMGRSFYTGQQVTVSALLNSFCTKPRVPPRSRRITQPDYPSCFRSPIGGREKTNNSPQVTEAPTFRLAPKRVGAEPLQAVDAIVISSSSQMHPFETEQPQGAVLSIGQRGPRRKVTPLLMRRSFCKLFCALGM